MRVIELHGVRVETCGRCQGHWLDSEELRRLAPNWMSHKLQPALRNAPQRCPHAKHRVPPGKLLCGLCGAAVVTCPSCGEHLSQVHTKVCDVDVCGQCQGLWLDAGELQALRQHKHLITPMTAGVAMAAAAAAAVAMAASPDQRDRLTQKAVDVAAGTGEVAVEAAAEFGVEAVIDGAGTAVEFASEGASAVGEAVGAVLSSLLELFN
jgi:Zn-finger nucleic acid-binding protein